MSTEIDEEEALREVDRALLEEAQVDERNQMIIDQALLEPWNGFSIRYPHIEGSVSTLHFPGFI